MPDSWVNLSPGPGSRRARLIRAVRDAVRSGQLTSGTRLPSYRALAADLGIARNTVAEAYAELVAEGWLTARQGSGTRVAARAVPPPPAKPRHPGAHERRPRHDLTPSSPDASAFPRTAWAASARRALTAAPGEAFGPGDPRGRPELRRALAEYLGRARGVRADAERIVICAGFAGGLRLLAELLPPVVAVESFGLRVHRELIEAAGRRTVPLPVDEHGAVIERMTAEAVLLTPAHQYPTGGALHAHRRAAVVDRGGLILEDDYDGEFRYDRQPIGAVQGLAPDRVLYLGSASKGLSPALRLGWMAVPDHLLDDLLRVKGQREFWTGVTDQLTMADLIASGGYDRHLRRMRQVYRRRRDHLVAVLDQEHPSVRVTGVAAGLHAVLALPPGTESRVLSAAGRQGVAVHGLSAYRHPDSPMPVSDGLVVGYGTPPEHGFPAAVTALSTAIRIGLAER